MQIWVRWDPTTEEAVIEDEVGQEYTNRLMVDRDGAFYLIGPIEIEDDSL